MNQAGMATSFGALATLQAQRGEDPEAIAYEVQSLAIHLGIGSPQASGNIKRLSGLRAKLGTDAFLAAVNELLGEESAQNLMDLLDQEERPGG